MLAASSVGLQINRRFLLPNETDGDTQEFDLQSHIGTFLINGYYHFKKL